MKKLLLGTAAVGLAVALVPSQAAAQLELNLGGYTKMYAFYTDQDDETAAAAAGDSRDFDIIRNTEIHFGGEYVLDNGLTVGLHFETEADGNSADGMEVQESYAFFSGGWGRFNVGAEDGAAYLLQVSAPSADENLDGIRQFVNPINFAGIERGGSLVSLNVEGFDGIDYDQDVAGYADKITYLSPVFNGFQLGVSFTPDVADASTEDALNFKDVEDAFGAAYEIGARYEGNFNDVGVILGAGYSHVDLEDKATQALGTITDDRTAWNVGLDLDIGPFGIGAAYMEDDFGDTGLSATTEQDEETTWVVGADYTTGPFKLGVSYLNTDGLNNVAGSTGNDGIEVDRYTGGVVYTYGPGMTFRGSVTYADFDNVGAITGGSEDPSATSVLLGTQINF